MKRRAFKLLNFFAFNLLFFALYLNFIHNDKNVQEAIHASNAASYNAANVAVANEKAEAGKTRANKGKATSMVSTKITETVLKSSLN